MYEVGITSFRTTAIGVCYYTLKTRDPTGEFSWETERRYKEFATLATTLRHQYPGVVFPAFPRKSYFSFVCGGKIKRKRSVELANYISWLLENVEPVPESVIFRDFLGIKNSFREKHVRKECDASRLVGRSKIPGDTVSYIMSFLDTRRLLYLGRISRAWSWSSRSGFLWRRIHMRSIEFQKVQRTLLNLLGSDDVCRNLEELILEIEFSPELYTRQISLPSEVHLESLKKFRFSCVRSVYPGNLSSVYLCQELLDGVLGHCTSLESLEIESSGISLVMLRTVAGICKLNPLTQLRLVFIDSADVSDEQFSIILDCLSHIQDTVRSIEILLEFTNQVPWKEVTKIPPSSAYARLLDVLDGCRMLKIFRLDFIPASFPLTDLSAALEELELKLVLDGDYFKRVPDTVVFSSTNLRVLKLSTTEAIGPASLALLSRGVVSPEWMISNLRVLSVEGLCNGGVPQYIRYVIENNKIDEFINRFKSSLTELTLIDCIYDVTEPFVEALLTQLPSLTKLILLGCNSKLSDTLLCKLHINSTHPVVRCIRTGKLRELKLPRTSYMSLIGYDAIQTTRGIVETVDETRVVRGSTRPPRLDDLDASKDFLHPSSL